MVVIAKKNPPLSFSIIFTNCKLFFTNKMISLRENTPPPRKSVSGYWPWNPNLSQCLPDSSGGPLKYRPYNSFNKSHLELLSSNRILH